MIVSTFDQYVATRSGPLLRFAYLLCGDRHLAEDLVQEVLIKAHRRWPAIEAGNPDAYLKQALVHTYVSWRRKRSSSEVAVAHVPDHADGDAFADRQASRDELWSMLATLSRAQRAVLVLRYFEDLDDQRIAEVVGIAPSTVRVHAHRGLNALRALLAERAPDGPDPAHLAEAVHRGIARAARRRRAAAATTAAVAVVVAVVLAVAVPRLWFSTGEPPAGPTPSGSPSVDQSMSPPPVPLRTVVLPEVPGYPYEFTWVAPPYDQPEVTVDVGRYLVSYGTQFDGYDVVISSEEFEPDWEPTQTSPVTVNGLPATLRTAPRRTTPDPNGMTGGPLVALTWQQDAMWISVRSSLGALDADTVLRVAEGIAPATPPAVRTHLASVAIPTDWTLDQWVPDSVCAIPPDAPPDPWGVITIGICITVVEEYPAGLASSLTIDGDPAELNFSQLIVHRADGRKVVIDRYYGSVPLDEVPSLGLTDELVVAMYRGLTFR